MLCQSYAMLRRRAAKLCLADALQSAALHRRRIALQYHAAAVHRLALPLPSSLCSARAHQRFAQAVRSIA